MSHLCSQKLQEAIRCWHNFREIERVITDWLQTAEKLISEKHVDSKQTVENHKVSKHILQNEDKFFVS